ncbi:MAG: NAD(P)H-dependent oxidoreductase subunit E, partial [Pseudomonadota bacterium]
MSPLDNNSQDRKGVWKSGRGKGRGTPKGRQLEDDALREVRALLGDKPLRRDLLIEHLHLIQDRYGCLQAKHLRALAEEMRLAQSEVYEVATFYAHFDVVKEGADLPPAITIRVCESLSCELAGAQDLLKTLAAKYGGGKEVRVLSAPCMGRCDTAPTLEIGHNHIDHATPAKVAEAIATDDTHTHIPIYETLEEYRDEGGYLALKGLRAGDKSPGQVQDMILESGLRGLGGAGFPSGRKWSFVRAEAGPRYLAVNGDEGEPGTFKDRYYLEREPHVFL